MMGVPGYPSGLGEGTWIRKAPDIVACFPLADSGGEAIKKKITC